MDVICTECGPTTLMCTTCGGDCVESPDIVTLEAQAETHRVEIGNNNANWQRSMDLVNLTHDRDVLSTSRAVNRLTAERERRIESLEADLAALRGEGEPALTDLICEVLGRLLIDVGQHVNPQIVADLDLTKIQRRAERCSVRVLAGDPHA